MLIGDDLLSRKIYVDHSYLYDVMDKAYKILIDFDVLNNWQNDRVVQDFTDFLTREDKFD